MHKFLNEIKSFEKKPYVIENFINQGEIKEFQKLYEELPVEINNKRQNIIKKKWTKNFFPKLQEIYYKKLKMLLDNFEMDNPKSKENLESLGLFQESFMPVSLHVDAGFDFNKIIYKQTLLPLSKTGRQLYLKIDFMGVLRLFLLIQENSQHLDITKDRLNILISTIENHLIKKFTKNI